MIVKRISLILGIAIERFFAMKYPLHVKTILTKPRILKAVVVIWLYTALVNLSPTVVNWNNWIPGIPCDLALVYLEMFLIVFYVVSLFIVLIVILFIYASIFKVLIDRKTGIQCNGNLSEIVQQQKVKIIERDTKISKGLAIVVAAYALCFVPMCIVLVISLYSPVLRAKLSYVPDGDQYCRFLKQWFEPCNLQYSVETIQRCLSRFVTYEAKEEAK